MATTRYFAWPISSGNGLYTYRQVHTTLYRQHRDIVWQLRSSLTQPSIYSKPEGCLAWEFGRTDIGPSPFWRLCVPDFIILIPVLVIIIHIITINRWVVEIWGLFSNVVYSRWWHRRFCRDNYVPMSKCQRQFSFKPLKLDKENYNIAQIIQHFIFHFCKFFLKGPSWYQTGLRLRQQSDKNTSRPFR